MGIDLFQLICPNMYRTIIQRIDEDLEYALGFRHSDPPHFQIPSNCNIYVFFLFHVKINSNTNSLVLPTVPSRERKPQVPMEPFT